MAMAAYSAGFEVRDMLMWRHDGGRGKAFRLKSLVERSKRFTRGEKDALVGSMGDLMTPQLRPMFEPLMLAMRPVEGTFAETYGRYATGLVDIWNEEGKQQTTVFDCPKPKSRKAYHHVTIKPVPLMVRLMEVFTRPARSSWTHLWGRGLPARPPSSRTEASSVLIRRKPRSR